MKKPAILLLACFAILACISLAPAKDNLGDKLDKLFDKAGNKTKKVVDKVEAKVNAKLDEWIGEPTVAIAGEPDGNELTLVDNHQTKAIVICSAPEKSVEKQAADDLVKYIKLMTGVEVARAGTAAEVADALKMDADHPLIVIGSAALKADPDLQRELDKVAKKSPTLRADAIVLKRKGNRVYVAGNHDESHYYAVAELLSRWGCRWYLPSEFGECIPEVSALKVGKLNYAFGSPFEVREFWISWNGESAGQRDFQLRNFMNNQGVSGGHILASYTKDLIPPGKTQWNIPIADAKTAEHVANHPEVQKNFAAGKDFSLGMEDGLYESDSKRDAELQAGLTDKYFISNTLTDNFMELYNQVAQRLLAKYPNSKSHIGFLAYSNITIPPQRQIVAAKPLVASLAPIDIDPNHGMDDARFPSVREYKEMVYRWSEVMQGRVFIYDYDQGMLVWRDLPNPSIGAVKQNMKIYRDAGILGVSTESRLAIATTFLNLYVRGQTMWNPDVDVDALLADFYPKFYGPAAEPMSRYWGRLFKAWDDTIVTEHEFFVIPAIYTPELVEALRKDLTEAEETMKDASRRLNHPPRDWKKYEERMRFTRLSFNLIDQYTEMWHAAATEGDYKKAVAWGDKAVATRMELGTMNNTFTTRVIPTMPAPETKEGGPAWLLGEVEQYRKLAELTDGPKGKLIMKLPVDWSYRRDPHDTGVVSGFAYKPADLSYWKEHGQELVGYARKDYPTTQWEMIRTDLYPQAQGILHPDGQSFTGNHWYKTTLKLDASQAQGKLHVRFPGIFNSSWLYVNGYLVSYRPQLPLWWANDYGFEWDVDVTGKLKAGENTITVRCLNPHHFGGMYRRPFVYREN
ncbi:MAG: DUF4838 domain-containing protein [Phycisphaeraceae bacterium]|nr:DUF4838 domain-containing protein [Phycisphaeraceae bacterium]